jgi:hypothetical protein
MQTSVSFDISMPVVAQIQHPDALSQVLETLGNCVHENMIASVFLLGK